MYRHILVPIDDAPLSRKAEAAAIDLAARLGAQLLAAHVVPDYPLSHFDGIAVEPEQLARAEAVWNAKGQALVDAAVAAAAQRGVSARGVLSHSDRVAESLVATARKHGCDLIVMASHGRQGLGKLLLGSQTQQVLARSPVPVLVLR